MKNALILFCVALWAASCNNQPSKPPETAEKAVTGDSVKTFLPVADLLLEDIRKTDSFATSILMRREMDGKKDSQFLKLSEFRRLCKPFLSPDLDSAAFQEYFTEASMLDESTRLLQFIYSTTSAVPQVRKVVVYVSPESVRNNVKRIYIEKSFSLGDTAIDQKLTWKMGGYFQIVTLSEPREGESHTRVEKVIWDPADFNDD